MQGKEEDEGILSYVEDDDAAMCVSAHRTFAVIFLECYKDLPPFDSMSMQGFAVAKTCVYSIKFFSNIQSKRIQSLAYILLTINEQILKLHKKLTKRIVKVFAQLFLKSWRFPKAEPLAGF